MELKYAHLADFATLGNSGKPIIVGIFDVIFAPDPKAIALPLCFLIAAFTAKLTEGTDHQLVIRLVDADGKEVLKHEGQMKLGPSPRRLLEGVFMIAFAGVPLPHYGPYDFDFFVDGQLKGTVSFLASAPDPK